MTTQKEIDKLKNDMARLNKTIKDMEERVKKEEAKQKQMWYVGQEVIDTCGRVSHIKNIDTEQISIIDSDGIKRFYNKDVFKRIFKPNPSAQSKINWIQNTLEEPEGEGLVLFQDGEIGFGSFGGWFWDIDEEDHTTIVAYAIIETPDLHYF